MANREQRSNREKKKPKLLGSGHSEEQCKVRNLVCGESRQRGQDPGAEKHQAAWLRNCGAGIKFKVVDEHVVRTSTGQRCPIYNGAQDATGYGAFCWK